MGLRFDPVESFSSANPFIVMSWSGFSLPAASMYPELKLFKVKTFTALTKSISNIGMTFGPANDFLSTLDPNTQEAIATAFLAMHLEISDPKYTVNEIEELEDILGDIILQLDDDTDLCGRINAYIRKSNIPISDMAEAGTRPQDTPEMTFVQEEAITITTIAILMKILCPILGAFTDKFNRIIDTKYKECHAHAIMTPVFKKRYDDIICKLTYYIKTLISSKLKSDPTAYINGNTLDAMTSQSLDTIIIKRFVNVDLYRPDGNVIKYIASCCRSGADSQQQNASMSNSVRIITDPVELDKDEGNASRMESESKQSIRTADVPVMIKVAARDTIRKIIKSENIDQELIDATFAYYKRNPVVMNPISEFLLCTYYGQDIGGGLGIMMLNSSIVSQLAALLQIICARDGIHNIAHALTFNIGLNDKTPTFESNSFSISWKSSSAYTDCKRVIPAGFGELDWDIRLKDIADFLATKHCKYNTAPAIWDLLNTNPCNEKPFTNFREVMVEIMGYICKVYTDKLL